MMFEDLGRKALKALDSQNITNILTALKQLEERGSRSDVLRVFDKLIDALNSKTASWTRDGIILCLRTHANDDPQVMDKVVPWAVTTLGINGGQATDYIQRAEAAHLVGYLKRLSERPSELHRLANKLLELANDSNEQGEVRKRCIQALGRINYTTALSTLRQLDNSTTDPELSLTLKEAIE